MDINVIGGSGMLFNGTPYSEVPIGYGVSLVRNDDTLEGYAGLSEAEKEKIILGCKDARTKAQMQGVVDSLAPGTDVQEVFEEEKESFS